MIRLPVVMTRVLWLALGTLIATAAALIVSVLLPKWLTPDVYGRYALLLAFAALGSAWYDLGVSTATMTRVSRWWATGDVAQLRREVDGLRAWLLGAGGVLAVLGYACAPQVTAWLYHDRMLGEWARLLLVMPLLETPYQLVRVVLQGTARTDALARLGASAACVRTALVLAAVLVGGGLHGIISALLTSSVIVSFLGWRTYRRERQQLPELPRLYRSWAWIAPPRASLGLGLRIALDKRLYVTTQQLPLLLVGMTLAPAATASVKLALGLMALPLVLLGPLTQWLAPRIAHDAALQDARALRRTCAGAAGTGLVLSLLPTLAMLWCAPRLLAWYGPAYAEVTALLVPLSIYAACAGSGVWLGPLFRAYERFGWTVALNVLVAGVLISVGPWCLRTRGLQDFLAGYALLQLARLLILCGVAWTWLQPSVSPGRCATPAQVMGVEVARHG